MLSTSVNGIATKRGRGRPRKYPRSEDTTDYSRVLLFESSSLPRCVEYCEIVKL